MSVWLLHILGREIYNKNKMIRKYEVAYYECGLTQRKTARFFFELSAYLFKGWLDYQFKGLAQVEIKEITNDN